MREIRSEAELRAIVREPAATRLIDAAPRRDARVNRSCPRSHRDHG